MNEHIQRAFTKPKHFRAGISQTEHAIPTEGKKKKRTSFI